MIITCPNCETQFNVDAAAFVPNGRTVRCAKCSHKWTQRPPDDAEAPAAPAAEAPPDSDDDGADDRGRDGDDFDDDDLDDEDIPEIVERPVVPGAGSSGRRGVAAAIAGWSALVLVIVAVLGGVFFARVEIVELWPPSSKLYALIGFPVPSPFDGLKIISEPATRQRIEGGSTVLVVSGEIVNNSAVVRDIPPLHVILLSERDNEIANWSFAATATQLSPGSATRFTGSYPDPPTTMRKVRVTFAAPE